jgi:signal transduction histidine kinase
MRPEVNEPHLAEVLRSLKLAVFQRDDAGGLRLASLAPEWLTALWPAAAAPGGLLQPEASPFLENFLIDARARWQSGGDQRLSSGPWVEQDDHGGEHHLQATALTAAGRAMLLIEELGRAYEERRWILQKAHEAALAYEQLQRAEQALAEEKRLLEQRVQERTAALSQANTELRNEIAMRRRYAERLQAMNEIDKAILAARSPEAIAEATLQRLRALLPFDQASVVEVDPDSRQAVVLAAFDGDAFIVGGGQLSAEQLLQSHALCAGELHRAQRAPNLFARAPGAWPAASRVWRHLLDLPLLAGGTLIGVLNFARDAEEGFTAEHEEIAQEIAAQLAVALRQARLFAEVSAGREQLRVLSLRLVEVQEAERQFLARELHDEIGQMLTGLKLTLEMAARQAPAGQGTSLGEAVAALDELMQRVRKLSLDLRPQLLDDLGLVPALEWHCQRFGQQSGLRVQFRHSALPERLPAALEIGVYRIVQEALTNVARHAAAPEAIVRLWSDGERLRVQVEDRGAGFEPARVLAARASTGLYGMRERASLLGGEFTLESAPGAGTRLTVELPLPAGP